MKLPTKAYFTTTLMQGGKVVYEKTELRRIKVTMRKWWEIWKPKFEEEFDES